MVRVLIAFGCALILLVVSATFGYLNMGSDAERVFEQEAVVDRSQLNIPALLVGSGFVVIGAMAALAVCDRQNDLEGAAQ